MYDASPLRFRNACADSSATIFARITRHMAHVLRQQVRTPSVRTLEAVASALCNRTDRLAASGPGGATGAPLPPYAEWLELLQAVLNEELPRPPLGADFTEPGLALCLRTAVRAVSRALKDPTEGATEYHSSDTLPDWARPRHPCAMIGTFIFYRPGV